MSGRFFDIPLEYSGNSSRHDNRLRGVDIWFVVAMINLKEETIYLQGARDVLLRLQDDFDMYIVPAVKYKHKTEDKTMWFPEGDRTRRKLLGDAMRKALLTDRESLVKFLSGDYDGFVITEAKFDKKGKATELFIKIE